MPSLRLLIPLGFFAFSLALHGQSSGGYACNAVAQVTPTIRLEGMTEQVGDIVITCVGGAPLPAGSLLPTTNIVVTLTQPVASRTFADGWSEALLLLDEPLAPASLLGLPAGSPLAPILGTAIAQRLCDDAANNCPVYATASGTGTFDGSAGRPNVFQGRVINSNQVEFRNIPVSAAGAFRITNVRVDASTNSAPPPGVQPVSATLSTSGAVSLPISNPSVTAAFIQQSFTALLLTPDGSSASSGWNFNQCAPGLQRVGVLSFPESFPSAFRTRSSAAFVDADTSPAPRVQNIPGEVYLTYESGFYAPALSGPNADFSKVGLADSGMRLSMYISNIRPGSRVFVSTTGVAFSGGVATPVTTGYGVARLIQDWYWPFAPTPVTATLEGIPAAELQLLAGGSATATWEVLSANIAAIDTFRFIVWVEPAADAPTTAFLWPSYGSIAQGSFPQFAYNGDPAHGAVSLPLFSTANCGVSFTTPLALPQATFGAAYTNSLLAVGGTPPYTFSVTRGSLPPGVTLSGGGAFSGAPEATGNFSFLAQVTDTVGFAAVKEFWVFVPGGGSLSITKTHTGNFTQGQTGATYAITVKNNRAIAAGGTVSVFDTLPAGLSATAIAGDGWTCYLEITACQRAGILPPGSSYPPVIVTVNVAADAAATVTNTASVSGGGGLNASVADPTTVIPPRDVPVPADFNRDYAGDMIWQDPVSGWAQIWYLGGVQGITVTGAANLTARNTWRVAGVADFNRDGHPDVVWQDPASGAAQIWFLGGAGGNEILSAAVLSNPNTWRIMSVADFNRDGIPDCIWQDQASGWAQIWFMGGEQGTTLTGAVNLTTRNTWRIAGTGDFNGDGVPDVIWQDPVRGATQVWYLTGAQGNVLQDARTLISSNRYKLAALADFNFDGHPDVVWQDPVTGECQAWLLNGPDGISFLGSAYMSGNNTWRIMGPH